MRKVIDTSIRLSIFVVIFIAMQIVAAIIVTPMPLGDNMSLQRFVTYVLSMTLTLISLKVFTRFITPEPEKIRCGRQGFNPIITLFGVVVLVALSIVLSPFEGQMLTDSREFDDSLWTLLTVVVAAPIFEEIIFRGKLYNILHVSCAPILAALLSSAVFGIVHFQPIVFISGILSGLLFSYAYIRTRSIYSPILLHMCNNALAYALTILSYSERSLLDLVESDAYNFIIYYVSSIILVVSMIAMVIRIARSR